MAFKRTPQKFSASINEVVIGTGDKAVTLGGANTFPLYTFDGEAKNKVAIGVEITDEGFDASVPGIAEYYAGCEGIGAIAKKASEMPGADFVVLSLEGADPNGANKSVEDCVAIAKEVADAIDCPLAVVGCKNVEKDTQLFEKVAEALAGKNVLFVSAREEDYKGIVAAAVMAYKQKISAESAVDINLANNGSTFQIPAGEWNFTLSVDNMTLVINKVEFPRGDVDKSGDVKIGDVTVLINYLLSGVWPE